MDNATNQYKRNKQSSFTWKLLIGSIIGLFFLFCGIVGTGIGLFFAVQDDLPSLAPLEDYNSAKWSLPTKVYSRDDEIIAKFYEKRRELIRIEEIPPELIQSLIVIEDNRFYQHNGVDFTGIARAAMENIFAGRIVEGGSTITQQLAKVLFLSSKQTFLRKIKEALLALQIERNYTKTEILERYFNKIYFGEGAYGVEAASQIYFGKSSANLNLAEAAMLAALPKAPNHFSPISNPDKAKKRHNLVISRLIQENYVSPEKAKQSYNQFWSQYGKQIYDKKERRQSKINEAPYFVEFIRRRLIDKYGSDIVYQGGLTVETTLHREYQDHFSKELNSYLLKLNKDQGNLPDTASEIPDDYDGDLIQGALMVRETQTGDVLAMVGGHKWHSGNQLNRAVQAKRQPGSAFKPILYTAALENGYSITSKLQDRPLVYQTGQGRWKPENYDGKYHGPVTLRTALINSLNVATVDLMEKIGSRKLIKYAQKLGINTKLIPHKSLALGGLRYGVTLKNLIDVYSVFANNGIQAKSISIREIQDREGNLLERNFPLKREVLSPQIAHIVTSLLRDVVDEGTGRIVGRRFNQPIAGKTGTTNDFKDAWFIGYTPDIVMGAWFGYDNNNKSLGEGMSGGAVAGRFWRNAASKVIREDEIKNFSVPPGIIYKKIDPQTGYLATQHCPKTSREPFITGTEPTQQCPIHTSQQVYR